MQNRIARNRISPSNEDVLIERYKAINPVRKNDKMDICAVITKSGEKGHGLLPESVNRSHDREYHIVKDFILDKDLKK